MPEVVFSDWSGGEMGDLGPTGCKDNQFSGMNVMVYKDGSVGPRPAVKASLSVNPTPLPWAFRGVGSPDGNHRVFIGTGKTIYSYRYGADTYNFLATISITVTVTTQIIQAGPAHAEIPIYGDKVYEVNDFGTSTVQAIPSSPGAQVGSLLGVRLMVGNTPTNPKRVYYTAAQTATAIAASTWPALNFFDVGLPDWNITFMDEQRQRMAIANNGGEWWGLSGTPGVNDSLRRQPRGDLSPFKWYHCARLGESVWFLPLGEDFPAQFTGSTVDRDRYKYLRFNGGTTAEFIAGALPPSNTALFASCVPIGSAGAGLMFHNDVWTYHSFTDMLWPIQFLTPLSVGGPNTDYDSPLLLAGWRSDLTTLAAYALQPSLDRPGKSSDTYAANLAPGTHTVTLATRYWWGQDRDIKITAITIDGFTWNVGAGSNNVDVQVRSLFRFGTVPYADSTVQSWSELASATTSDRTDKRFRVTNPDAPWAQGFQIRLSAINGFAVRRIRVEYDEGPKR